MVTFLQNIETDSAESKGIGDKALTDIVFDYIDLARVALNEVWGVVLDFNVQVKVLLLLICWLILTVVSINIAWKIYCPSIRNPDIPGKLCLCCVH
jgi:hypothetical protein